MNRFVLLTSVTAFSLLSAMAGAATLKNTDKDAASVTVELGAKKETISLKSGASYDSKGKDASFTLGSGKPVLAKGSDQLIIKGGKIEPVKTLAMAKTPDSAAPAGKTIMPASPVANDGTVTK